jgi:hypothetical protein
MKQLLYTAIILLTGTMSAYSQAESDVLMTSQTNITGTARSMGLSNAMGAVGGDMSALSINPAGIAVYRSSEFSFSTGLLFNKTEGTYNKYTCDDNKTSIPLNHIGMIGTYKPMRDVKNGIVSSHFGFTYNRINNFNQNIYWQGNNVGYSFLDKIVREASGNTSADFESNPNTLASQAYYSYLISPLPNATSDYSHAFEGIDENNNIQWRANNGIQQSQVLDINGHGGEYSLTGGMNISNIILLGGSVNFQHIGYEETSVYYERNAYGLEQMYNNNSDEDLNRFDYTQVTRLQGTSVNFKVGAIIKPINSLRIGLAIHSPNYFNFHQEYQTKLTSYWPTENSEEAAGNATEYNYNLNTPMRFIGSIAYVFGNRGLISGDYEYQDYSTARFRSTEDNDIDNVEYLSWLNHNVDGSFTKVHTFRFGGEFRVTDNVILRAGYSLQGSPYKSDYLSKKMKLETKSAGIGYRTDGIYVDFAFMAVSQNKDHYAYNWSYEELPIVQPTQIKSYTYYGNVTVGWKF